MFPVSEAYKERAKKQIAEFKKIPEGAYRYIGVEAWRGIVCEFIVNDWLNQGRIRVLKQAKGLDTSGKTDPYDILTSKGAIEVASATKHHFKYVMPKKQPVDTKSDDTILIGARYDETVEPNSVEILGYMRFKKVKTYPVEQNKGAPYYKVPLTDLMQIGN